MNAKELIENRMKQQRAQRVSEASIALAPGSDPMNTVGNAGTLLKAASEQIGASIRMIKGDLGLRMSAKKLAEARKDIDMAALVVDDVLNTLLEY